MNSANNIWIVKPGEDTNQGHGIHVAQAFNDIKALVTGVNRHTYILQKYIHNPLLIKKRKFDIRTYAILANTNGNLKGYMYEEGYLRTSSQAYSTKDLSDRTVHLTNDMVQKNAKNYGKFE